MSAEVDVEGVEPSYRYSPQAVFCIGRTRHTHNNAGGSHFYKSGPATRGFFRGIELQTSGVAASLVRGLIVNIGNYKIVSPLQPIAAAGAMVRVCKYAL